MTKEELDKMVEGLPDDKIRKIKRALGLLPKERKPKEKHIVPISLEEIVMHHYACIICGVNYSKGHKVKFLSNGQPAQCKTHPVYIALKGCPHCDKRLEVMSKIQLVARLKWIAECWSNNKPMNYAQVHEYNEDVFEETKW